MPSYLKKLIAINIVLLLLIVLGWVGFSWLESSPLPDNFGFLSSNIDEESSSGSTELTATSATTTAFLSAGVDWETRTVDPDSINWQQLQDPFTAEPSFYSGRNTFQPLLKLTTTQETGQGYAVYTFSQQQIDGEQQPEHLQSYVWLMYGQSNELTRTIVSSYGLSGLNQFFNQLLISSKAMNFNPAVTWLFFSKLSQVDSDLFSQGLPVSLLISKWRKTSESLGHLSEEEKLNNLTSIIQDLDWTESGKEILYFSLLNFEQETVEKIFSQSGWLSYSYQNSFVRPFENHSYKFRILPAEQKIVEDLAAYYKNGHSMKQRSVICHAQQAQMCELTEQPESFQQTVGDQNILWWQCSRVPDLDSVCFNQWLPKLEML